MNQKEFEKQIKMAENAFQETVNGCFYFFKENTNKSDLEILVMLQYATAKVVEGTQ